MAAANTHCSMASGQSSRQHPSLINLVFRDVWMSQHPGSSALLRLSIIICLFMYVAVFMNVCMCIHVCACTCALGLNARLRLTLKIFLNHSLLHSQGRLFSLDSSQKGLLCPGVPCLYRHSTRISGRLSSPPRSTVTT